MSLLIESPILFTKSPREKELPLSVHDSSSSGDAGKLFQQAIRAWNSRNFEQVPEYLEPLWLNAGNQRKFFLGLIRAANAWSALQEEKSTRAVMLLGQALEKLQGYPEQFQQIELGKLRQELLELCQELKRAPGVTGLCVDFPSLHLNGSSHFS